MTTSSARANACAERIKRELEADAEMDLDAQFFAILWVLADMCRHRARHEGVGVEDVAYRVGKALRVNIRNQAKGAAE